MTVALEAWMLPALATAVFFIAAWLRSEDYFDVLAFGSMATVASAVAWAIYLAYLAYLAVRARG